VEQTVESCSHKVMNTFTSVTSHYVFRCTTRCGSCSQSSVARPTHARGTESVRRECYVSSSLGVV